MPDDYNPWAPPPDEPKRSNTRFFVFLGLIALGVFAVWQLRELFPGALSNVEDQGSFMQLSVLAVVVASGIVYSRRVSGRETVRNIAIWAGIAVALGFGYVFYHQIKEAALDVRSELVPGYAAKVNANTIAFTENRDGDFSVIGSVNGTAVEFLVDTGATDIVLSPADAERAGIDLSSLHFNRAYETANGEGRGAAAIVDRLEIGPVKLFDVPVSVNATKMRSSLLGMAFLKRMKSFEMKGRKLYLRWR